MKFGICAASSGALASQDCAAVARAAEENGFDSVWVFDHLFDEYRAVLEARR